MTKAFPDQPKVLTDWDISELVSKVICGDLIDDRQLYLRFLTDIGCLLTEYLGGKIYNVDYEEEMDSYIVIVGTTSELPAGGGAWAGFDPDVDWSKFDPDKGWEEK